jgi:hypothetical protein
VIKKEAEKISTYKDLITEMQLFVEYESISDNGNNRGDWKHYKVTETKPEQHTGRARN